MEREIAALIADAAGADGPEAFRAAALARIGRCVGFDEAIFLPFDDSFAEAAPAHVRAFGTSARYQRELARVFVAGARDAGTYVDTLLFTAAERDRLSFFRDVIRPTGATSTLVSAIHFRGVGSGIVHLYRKGATRAFSRAEQDALRPLLMTIGALHAAFAPRLARPVRHAGLARLSPRERTVAALVAEGLGNLQIAARLGRSPHTIRHQLESIFAKCGVANRTDLALLVRAAPDRPMPEPMLRTIDRLDDMLA